MVRALALEWIVLRVLVGLSGIALRGGGSRACGLAIFLDRVSHVGWTMHAARVARALR